MENAIDFEIPEVEKRALEDELNEFTKSKNEDNNEERRLVLSAQQAIEQPEVGQIIESVAKMNWTEANGNTYVGTGFLAKINLGEEDRLGFFTAGHNLVDESTHQVLKANSVKLRFRHIRKYTIKVNLSKLLRQTHILIVAHKKTIKIIKDGQTSIQSCRKGIDFGVVLFTSAVDSAARFLHKLGLSYLQVARPGACGSAPNMPVQLVGFPQYVENSPISPMRILPGNELAVPEGSIPDHSYTLETQPGASGGSVFDKGGRVIAVHVKGQNLEKGDQGNWGLGFDIIRNELLQCLGGSGMALELQRTASDLNINQGMLKLTSFLRRLKLEKYIPIFEEEDIDFQVLEICKPEELEELLGKIGISLGHIKKIRKAMQEEKREEGAETIQTDGCPTQTTREKFPGIRISPVVTKSSVMADTNQTPSEIDTLYLDTDKSGPPPKSSPRPSASHVDQVASSPSAQPKKKTSKLKQQELPIWQPVVTVRTILPYLFIIGIVFVPAGIGFIYASDQVRELEVDYTYCSNRDNEKPREGVSSCANSSTDQPVSCVLPLDELKTDWTGNVFLYYGLDNLFQNHRLYVKSRDDKQLAGNVAKDPDDNCKPFDRDDDGVKYVPCGAVANNMFNDNITLKYSEDGNTWEDVPLLKTGIALPSDKATKFANPKQNDGESLKDAFLREGNNNISKPRDWTKNIWELDPTNDENNGFQNEDFLVWMRTATLSNFRKLYRRIDHTKQVFQDGLPKKFQYRIHVECHYNVAQFEGRKKVILSTTSVLGGKNNFLGVMYVVTGSLCFILGLFFLIINRKYGVVGKQLKQKL